MSEFGAIGRVTSVQSTSLRVALDLGAKGFTKVGPTGLHTVGVVNSYVTVPAGAHRVVAIVTGVRISRRTDPSGETIVTSEDDQSAYELEAAVVGRFEGGVFKSGMTGYPPLHAPVHSASPNEVKSIFLPRDVPSLRLGTSTVAADQDVHLDANLLLGHHCAVVGSTGSGKSCTVMAIIDGLLDQPIPNGHIVIFDVNGEYAQSFHHESARGRATRPVVLGPTLGTTDGLFLPHWFMNNEENLSLFRAGEGVQTPVLQRSVADARATEFGGRTDVNRLLAVRTTITTIEGLYSDRQAQLRVHEQLAALRSLCQEQVADCGPCSEQWAVMLRLVVETTANAGIAPVAWTPLNAQQIVALNGLFDALRTQVSAALGSLNLGSAQASADFDAPAYYSLQELCDFFLPNRVSMEQASDNRISAYVATLQMRLSRLLADGRYDFMTRVEKHYDPLGSYLRLLMGADPTQDKESSDWPAAQLYQIQAKDHASGPSVTIFDLSLVASDVLENVTALLGRILFDFAVRSDPRAEHPVLLVLEEAHRFIPARNDSFGAGSRSTSVFERIAKEGRKFGLSLLLASQRPSELSETVVAQCGTVIAHRLTHEADQNLLRHATSLSSRSLLDQLPGLAQQHALVTGVSTGVPVAVRVRDVPDAPKSNDPDFMNTWADGSKLEELPRHIDGVVARWLGAPKDLHS
ncbi:ATP-binding protein [Arthrobacter koreensis]|uniref:ATP-binding protein n=1 Tax=Arthrobacter koreensis TaxID=199136 RepID=UPI0036D95F18